MTAATGGAEAYAGADAAGIASGAEATGTAAAAIGAATTAAAAAIGIGVGAPMGTACATGMTHVVSTGLREDETRTIVSRLY